MTQMRKLLRWEPKTRFLSLEVYAAKGTAWGPGKANFRLAARSRATPWE